MSMSPALGAEPKKKRTATPPLEPPKMFLPNFGPFHLASERAITLDTVSPSFL